MAAVWTLLLVVSDAAWYDGIESVHVLRPGDDASRLSWKLYSTTKTKQFSTERHALLLTSGDYSKRSEIAVGYYTSVSGVGYSPDDVTVDSFYTLDNPKLGNACQNFWRSVEGLRTTNPSIMWAASQAAPLRRVHVQSELWLSQEGAPHWSSGGFMSSSEVDGPLQMGTQQQYLVRNARLAQGAVGKLMNYVFVGVDGAPPNSTDGRISNVATTPRVAEKPYLVERAGEWAICVPPMLSAVSGIANSTACGRLVSLDDTYVAKAGESAATILAGLRGKHALLLTPGLYALEQPLTIDTDDLVVLGIGFATLMATNGQSAIVVTGAGVRVAGVLLEATTDVAAPPTAPLLLWSGDDGVGSDLFTRVAALAYATPDKPRCRRPRADTHLHIDGSGVVLDNTWMWHADHDDCGGASDRSFSAHGLVVRGDDVLAYGLKAEHTMDDLVVWEGERGRVLLFQSELPYHFPSFAGVGYRVAPGVRAHTALGVGVYIVGELVAASGMVFPASAQAANLFTWVIGRNHTQFRAVVCTNTSTSSRAGEAGEPAYAASYQGGQDGEVCYQGDVCDHSSCYQLALPPPPE